MTIKIKIKNSGEYISKVNGKPIVNNQYFLDIDSDRAKKEQVLGMYNKNGIIESEHNTLQNYMKKMSSKNSSIFDLIKKERKDLHNIPNITQVPNMLKKMIMPKKQNTKKITNNGISSKLFEFTNMNTIIDHNPKHNPNPLSKYLYKSLHANIRSRKKRRKKETRKRRNNRK